MLPASTRLSNVPDPLASYGVLLFSSSLHGDDVKLTQVPLPARSPTRKQNDNKLKLLLPSTSCAVQSVPGQPPPQEYANYSSLQPTNYKVMSQPDFFGYVLILDLCE